jgi:uncharacterized protein
MNQEFTDNTDKKQFELITDGITSKIEYILMGGKIIFTHTEVPQEFEGKGIGAKLVELALKNIESRGLKLIPLCPFTASYIKRHPEWMRVLDTNTKLK